MVKPIHVSIHGKNHPFYFEWYARENIRNLSELTGHPTELYYSTGKQRSGTLAKTLIKKRKLYCFFTCQRDFQKQLENILMMI